PICEAFSSPEDDADPRYLVGPILNVANSCARWAAGPNERSQRTMAELNDRVADSRRAWADLLNPPVLDSSVAIYSDTLRTAAANADADVLECGLQALNVSPETVESICIRYVTDVAMWSKATRTDRATRLGSSDADAGYRRKETPFAAVRGKTYR